TSATAFACPINAIKKFPSAQGGEWQPPADWLEVPEPGEWEACFLIEPKQRLSFKLTFYGYESEYRSYCGNVTIDWGDGTVETYEGNTNIGADGYPIWTPESKRRPTEITHNYAEAGQYIIKATVDEYCSFLSEASDGNHLGTDQVNLLIAKLGKNIRLKAVDSDSNFGNGFAENYRLCWVKINGSSEIQGYEFGYCQGFMRLDLAEPLTELSSNVLASARVPKIDLSRIKKIKYGALTSATNLPENVSFPECTEIERNTFVNARIKSISAPKCTIVGNSAFEACCALESAKFADDCTFGTNCFRNCHSLYPRPDGSTN
ncbi:MAG: leucine-rich repeat domain-containing protein, partial [Oscillospiraceae bacterium]|nr:leucine-rich repeat domain-containing protein [Oscillospiraceae bacterium]